MAPVIHGHTDGNPLVMDVAEEILRGLVGRDEKQSRFYLHLFTVVSGRVRRMTAAAGRIR